MRLRHSRSATPPPPSAPGPPAPPGDRLRAQARVLVELARALGRRGDDLDAVLRQVVVAAADTLEVERASIWLYDPERTAIRCVALYERGPRRHSRGAELAAAHYPSYFAALEEERSIAAHDAHADPRTREFSASYLAPLGISSMLDAPIRVGGQMVGVVCHEHVGAARRWSADEESFAASIADIVSLAVEEAERRRAEAALRESEARYRAMAEERARLLEREQAARAQAESASRLKDEFLATVSHELRTPLNAIVGWAHLLLSGKLDIEGRMRGLEAVERNAKAQAQLIDDLLDVSRIIQGKLRLQIEPFDLGEVVAAAVESLRPAAEARGLRLETVLQTAPTPFFGDPSRMRQVAWNLLSNAIKFTPASGRVTTLLEYGDGEARLTVRDTGRGISPEYLPYVFDRFSQGERPGARPRTGLGLGLSIVRHLVELHGGGVRAESAGEAQGSTFTVFLPLGAGREPGAAMPPLAAADAPPAVRLVGVRVAVVDDEPDTREVLCTALGLWGAEARAVASAADALELVRAWRPDILVADLGMPEEDGYALIRRLRELPTDEGGRTPAIALTAYARLQDRVRALAAGYQEFLSKPADPPRLAETVAKLAGLGG